MTMKIERVWKHKENICVVIMTDLGHRCGYVGVKPTHQLYNADYHTDCPKLHDRLEELKNSPIGDKGIIPILCWDGEKVSPELLFNVHGGLTYSGNSDEYPTNIHEIVGYRPWWFGYDCAHSGDGRDLSVLSKELRQFYSKYPSDEPIRSLEYCIEQCEKLSEQLSKFE